MAMSTPGAWIESRPSSALPSAPARARSAAIWFAASRRSPSPDGGISHPASPATAKIALWVFLLAAAFAIDIPVSSWVDRYEPIGRGKKAIGINLIKKVGDFRFAVELIDLAREHADFSICVSAFPEVHPDSPSREDDRRHLAPHASRQRPCVTCQSTDVPWPTAYTFLMR